MTDPVGIILIKHVDILLSSLDEKLLILVFSCIIWSSSCLGRNACLEVISGALGHFWLVLFSTFCTNTFMIVKGGEEADGSCFRIDVRGSNISGYSSILMFGALVMVEF